MRRLLTWRAPFGTISAELEIDGDVVSLRYAGEELELISVEVVASPSRGAVAPDRNSGSRR